MIAFSMKLNIFIFHVNYIHNLSSYENPYKAKDIAFQQKKKK